MALIFLALFWSTMYSEYPEVSIGYALRYLLLGSSFYYFAKLSSFSYSDKERLLSDYLWGSVLGGLVFAVTSLAMNASASQYFMRLTLGESSAIPLAVYLGQALVAIFALLVRGQPRGAAIFLACAIPPVGFAFLATNTRSVVIGLCLSVIVLFASAISKLSKRSMWMVVAIAAFGLGGFAYLYESHPETISRLVSASTRISTGSLGESEGERVTAWLAAWDTFTQSPLLGIGAGSFMEKYGLYPHNSLLELSAEIGVLGAVLFLFFLVNCLLSAISQIRRGDGALPAMFMFHLIVAMVSMAFWMHKLLFLSAATLIAYGSTHLNRADRAASSIKP